MINRCNILLVIVTVIITAIFTAPIYLAVILPRSEIVLSDSVVTLKVFDTNVLRSKYGLDLTIANTISSKVVNEHN